jgi:hypothetical protein
MGVLLVSIKTVFFVALPFLFLPAFAQELKLLDAGNDTLADYRSNQTLQQRVNTMIAYAKASVEPHSTNWCYHYVKEALLLGEDLCSGNTTTELPKRGTSCGGSSNSVIHAWPDGGSAYMAVDDLKASPFDMINLLDNDQYSSMASDPDQIPKGAVVVYSNGVSDGHVEIKADDGRSHYYSDFDDHSDFLHTQAGSSHPYEIIGVMLPTK